MKPSDLFWDKYEDDSRGKIQEMLAELICQVADDESYLGSGNGMVIDALEYALDQLYENKVDKLIELLDDDLEF